MNIRGSRGPRWATARSKVYEHLLGSILDMDLEEAADFIMRGQPNPYHNRKVAGG